VKTLAAPALGLALALVAPLAPAHAVNPHTGDGLRAAPRSVELGGVRVRLQPGTEQVVTVNRRRGHHATVTFWARDDDGGWTARRTARDGRIGYGGVVPGDRRRQGTGTTPLGTHRLFTTFGTHGPATARRSGWDLPYRPIRRGDFWVQDNRSRFYNRYRNISRGGFRPHTSERLTDYGAQYEYVVVLDYNREQVRGRGAGIFLHVNGDGATAGCVSAPRRFLTFAMRWLNPAKRPVIAVGR
jgi:L,D-peptidoglycan transpeptidase YkuD (ErfK/YbiS/YcfS/YnhG family)